MGLLTIIKKVKAKEKEMRILIVCVASLDDRWMPLINASRLLLLAA